MRNTKILLPLLLVTALVLPFTAFAQDATPEATMMDMGEPVIGQDMMEACPAPMNLPDSVNMGAIFGLSGPISVYGGPQQQAVQLAEQQINDMGYLGDGTTINFQFEDSTGTTEGAINAMTKLVEDDQVVAVIGPTLSNEATAADPVAMDAETPVLGVSNTASNLRQIIGDYYHRDSLPEAVVIPGTISQATTLLGLTKVGVLYGNDDDFTVSGYDVFVEALHDNSVSVVGTETFAKGDVDFNAQLTNLISQDPDALVVSALAAEAVQVINQARQLGYDGPIIGGNGFNSPAVLSQTAENAEGLIVGGAWNYDNPNPSESSKQFAQEYESAYGNRPDQFAAQAYTGAWLLATAVRCADSVDHTAVNDALSSISEMETPLGAFSFGATGEPVHEPIAQIVQDGKFVPLASVVDAGM